LAKYLCYNIVITIEKAGLPYKFKPFTGSGQFFISDLHNPDHIE